LAGLNDHAKAMKLSTLYTKTVRSFRDGKSGERKKREKKKQQIKSETLGQAINAYLKEIDQNESSRTFKEYKNSLFLYLKTVGDFQLKFFDRDEHNIPFFNFLSSPTAYNGKRPYSRDTQNKHQRHVQGFFNWCKLSERINENVVIKKARRVSKDMDTLEISELEKLKKYIHLRLLESIEKEKNATGERERKEAARWVVNYKNLLRSIFLGQHTLLRTGAMWSLKLSNIDLERKQIKIRDNDELNWVNKWKKWPNKPINDVLAKILKADIESRPKCERYYLDNGQGGPWYEQEGDMPRLLGRVMLEAGLPKLDMPYHYGIRATMCTNLLLAGENIVKVQCLMDHRDISTTMKYLNKRKVNQADATDNLAALLSNSSEQTNIKPRDEINDWLNL